MKEFIGNFVSLSIFFGIVDFIFTGDIDFWVLIISAFLSFLYIYSLKAAIKKRKAKLKEFIIKQKQ